MLMHDIPNTDTIKIPIRELNKNISCKLCFGYFIEPVKINECLHTCNFDYNQVNSIIY